MKRSLLILTVVFLWTCSGGGGGGPTEPQGPTYVVNLASLSGNAQKGPFNNGTAINIAELTNTLSPTGRNFSTAITDNTGRFSVTNVQLESPYVELRANGYYFNEVSNEISSGQLTLFALSNLSGKTSLNVNILTHLEKNRMTTLIGNTDNPKTFAEAKVQAQEEVFEIFDYSRANVPESELLDISQGGAANAKLLAISAIVQGDLTVGQMSELLANISTDIASDGILDDATLRNTLIDNSKNLDLAQIRANLEARYALLGISANIPDFETEVNQFLKPPVANDMNLSTDEDTQINITLDASDPENESLTFSAIEVNNATVTINGNVANYIPDAHFNGTDTFTYKANDGTSDSNIATVTVTVNAIDDEPNTNDISTTTDEDVSVVLTLTADEYDGDSYSFEIITQPSNGSASLDGSSVTYSPNENWNGEDAFTFEATDDTGRNINIATATITVNPVNDAPTMRDTTFTFVEDCPPVQDEEYCVDIDVLDYLFSDIDSNSGDASVTLNSEPQHGSLALQGARFLYNPNKDWYGEDSMTYVVNDGDGGVSDVASINLVATAVNDAPTTSAVSVSTNEDTAKAITLDGSDVEGSSLTYSIVSDVSNGTTSLSGSTVTYTPDSNWNGTDTFTYKANDGTDDSNTSTVTITVAAVNDAPVASAVSASTNEDTAKAITLSATDTEGGSLTYNIVSSPPNGSLGSVSGTGVTYTPSANFNGTDTFTYKATDGTGEDSNTATVTITVAAVNDAPIAYDFNQTTEEDNAKTITLRQTSPGSNTGTNNEGGVYDPDIETDQDTPITFSLVSQPSNGTATLASGDNDITYTPDANWNGTDTFTYKGNDGTADSNTATITVTVTAVNDIPTTNNVSRSTNQDTAVDITLSAEDPDATILTFSVVSGPSNGTVTLDNDTLPLGGIATYTPNTGWNGTDTFNYKANDGTDDSNISTVDISVTSD